MKNEDRKKTDKINKFHSRNKRRSINKKHVEYLLDVFQFLLLPN